jgi:hypothetical protein
MRNKIDVSPFRDQLVFGRGYVEQAMNARDAQAAPMAALEGAGLQWQAA